MNKIKTMIAVCGLVLFGLSSCTVVHTAIVTNNPVGDKVGVAKASNLNPKADASFKTAMEKGKIEKVGIAEYKVTYFLFFINAKTTVTGE